jgi:sulfotransferase family protein
MSLHCARPPVIILGMARSGTTLLADLLRKLGLFIGHHRIEHDQEAWYFVRANRTVIQQAHGNWDNPRPMRYFLELPEAMETTLGCLEADLRSPRIAGFLGPWNFLRYRSLERFDRPWGWKDPRNVFTLPLWLKLFPGARLLYIARNGVDVARSLQVLERKVIERRMRRRRRTFAWLRGRSRLEHGGFKGAVRCLSLEGGFSLWEEYVAQAEEVLAGASSERMVLRYESLLEDPRSHLEALARFTGLTAPRALIEEAARTVNRQRAFAFTDDPTLREFFLRSRGSAWMERLGYSELQLAGVPAGAGPGEVHASQVH